MKEIKGSIMINVPADKVWASLTDFTSYPKWNPFLTNMKGELEMGNVFDVTVSLPERKDTRFPSKIVRMDQGKEILAKGTIKKGMLYSDHLFLIEPLGENKCMFTQSIVFRGFMSYFAGGVIRDSQKGLNRMNEETKKLCEGAK
jgi:hypothetical protein